MKNKGGRPRVGDGKLPPVTVPSEVEKLAKELADYDGISLAAFIRRAVVIDLKTRRAKQNVHTEGTSTT